MTKEIPKLKALRLALGERNFWDYVDGSNPKPPGPAYDDVIRLCVEDYLAAEYVLSEWTEKDNEAIKLITSTIPLWMINTLHAEHRMTSMAMFDEVSKRYNDGDLEKVMRWRDLSWDGASDMSDFLDEWSTTLADCLDNDEPITPLSQASQLTYAVKDRGNKEVDTWASAVFEKCSKNTVSPLHRLLEELIEVFEKQARGGAVAP
ncbi:hypothetical protein IWX90DRAFT_411941 [Phyllosticta citrichinensis]|uniref:Uncharacterized protein n=1 Tax=Phyllosticta citrichinensis TaxID=1130410 RepID=A0ABR1Y2I0_9PEZI